mmetsp:Transcript_59612/g.158625  ORF Transcript_59612/g.158625 Transcript_59612/m.158625 type:complete len:110 (+) Transcript_59612:160-489(+)
MHLTQQPPGRQHQSEMRTPEPTDMQQKQKLSDKTWFCRRGPDSKSERFWRDSVSRKNYPWDLKHLRRGASTQWSVAGLEECFRARSIPVKSEPSVSQWRHRARHFLPVP